MKKRKIPETKKKTEALRGYRRRFDRRSVEVGPSQQELRRRSA